MKKIIRYKFFIKVLVGPKVAWNNVNKRWNISFWIIQAQDLLAQVQGGEIQSEDGLRKVA